MKLTPRWYVFGVVWVTMWAWPLAARPLILAKGRPVVGEVRSTVETQFRSRCLVHVGVKFGAKRAKFYGFASPAGCAALKVGAPIKLHMMNLGPLFWVVFDNDYGFYKRQWLLDIGLFIPCTALIIYGALWLKRRPPPKGDFMSLLKDL